MHQVTALSAAGSEASIGWKTLSILKGRTLTSLGTQAGKGYPWLILIAQGLVAWDPRMLGLVFCEVLQLWFSVMSLWCALTADIWDLQGGTMLLIDRAQCGSTCVVAVIISLHSSWGGVQVQSRCWYGFTPALHCSPLKDRMGSVLKLHQPVSAHGGGRGSLSRRAISASPTDSCNI